MATEGANLVKGIFALSLAASLPSVGCYFGSEGGGSGGAGGGDVSGGGSGGTDGDAATLCAAPTPGASPLRRLTPFEIDNTLEDLLGDDTRPGSLLPEEGGSGFDNNAEVSVVTRSVAQKYMQISEDVAGRATQDLSGLLGCDAAADGCVRGWIDSFGRRVWRRPLQSSEVDDMLALYEAELAGSDPAVAMSVVLQAFLQSPFFLYRVELGAPDSVVGEDAVKLTDWEMATRLSYFLWGSTPDEALLAAAEAGSLQTPEQIEAQARRMLDDPKARRMARHFYEQWLGYNRLEKVAKDPAVFPEFGPDLVALQRQELETFIDHVLWESDAKLATLLTAPYTFVNAELAAFYGVDGVDATQFEEVAAPGVEHSGILSMGGLLSVYAQTNQTSPITRGLFVRHNILCQSPPPPPDNVDLDVPPPSPDATTRERYAQHREDPACFGCHQLMDPLGFGFENFDGIGRWREEENGEAIDASGELVATDVDGDFYGVRELGERLATSNDVRSCVARQWFRFAQGRTESPEADACTLGDIEERFAAADYDLRELMVSLTQTDAFLYRRKGDAQ